jgi:hypothetical protein
LWRAASSDPSTDPAPAPVANDLELLGAVFDAAPEAAEERTHELLIAGERDLYLARVAEHDLLAQPKSGAEPRTLAMLEQPAYDMTLAAGALWLTTRAASSPPGARDGRAPTDSGVVERVSLSGGKPTVIAAGLSAPRAIAADGEWVFVVDTDASEAGLLPKSSIVRIPARGGPATVMARSEGEIDAIAMDGPLLYWSDRLDGSILSLPKTGGTPQVVASERGLPEKLRAFGGALYWIERRSESLWTMPAAGGKPRQITQDLAGFANVVVDGRGVWWTNEAAIDGAFRVLVAPGPAGQELEVSGPVSSVDALATDGQELFWDQEGVVSRVEAVDD